MTFAEKRKQFRRTVRYPARIETADDAEPIKCFLCDASQEGALLQVDNPADLPDEFTLLLSSDGSARRRCAIKWRTETQVGVEFKKTTLFDRKLGHHVAAREQQPRPDDEIDIDSFRTR
jgi:hypothetical protein